MVRLFKGTCQAVRAMHTYRAPAGPAPLSRQNSPRPQEAPARHSDDDERFPQAEGDADGGYSYDSTTIPLVTKHRVEDQGDVVFDGDEELSQNIAASGATEVVPYAHRDLKPG